MEEGIEQTVLIDKVPDALVDVFEMWPISLLLLWDVFKDEFPEHLLQKFKTVVFLTAPSLVASFGS